MKSIGFVTAKQLVEQTRLEQSKEQLQEALPVATTRLGDRGGTRISKGRRAVLSAEKDARQQTLSFKPKNSPQSSVSASTPACVSSSANDHRSYGQRAPSCIDIEIVDTDDDQDCGKNRKAEVPKVPVLTAPSQELSLNSVLVGRQFHRPGNAELLDNVRNTATRLRLPVKREPDNSYDPMALLVLSSDRTVARPVGHLPREIAQVLSPFMDAGVLAPPIAEIDVNELKAQSAISLRPVALHLCLELLEGCPPSVAVDLRQKIAAARAAGPVAAVARPRPQASGEKQRRAPAQRSLLMNFGRTHQVDKSGTILNGSVAAARFSNLLGGLAFFAEVARHLGVGQLLRLRPGSQKLLQAVDSMASQVRYRVAVERAVCGYGWSEEIQKEMNEFPLGLRGVLTAVERWTPGLLSSATVLEHLRAADFASARAAENICARDRVGTFTIVLEHLRAAESIATQLGAHDGWQLLAALIWIVPAFERLRLIQIMLKCDKVSLNLVRELLALLVLLARRYCGTAVDASGRTCACSKVGGDEEAPTPPPVGIRRLHADLLVCNRLLESAGLKLPLTGLHMPGLRLTDEQEGIVSRHLSPVELLVISAFAGTGKTSTLRMYALIRPHLKFLYICFNVSVREEAQRSFPRNVTCKNIHQLAFAACGVKFKHKLSDDLRPEELAGSPLLTPLLPRKNDDDACMQRLECAQICVDTLAGFLNSADQTVSAEHLPKQRSAALRGQQVNDAQVLAVVADIWCQMCDPSNESVKMTHNGYLKLYSLSKPRLRGDVIMLDEAQDCNPAIGDIVIQQPCARILVGDEHQAIYGFLGAQDMLGSERLGRSRAATGTILRRQLTRCFRFGPDVADVANFLLRWKGETRPLLGCSAEPGVICFQTEDSETDLIPSIQSSDSRRCRAFIARSNVSIFAQALRAEAANLTLEWVGGIRSYRLGFIKDLCLLAIGERDRIQNGRVKAFKSLQVARHFAKRTDDRELIARTELVNSSNPLLLFASLERLEQEAEKRENSSRPPQAQLALATVHKAKGLEWDEVWIAEDFTDIGSGEAVDGQELNMLYVAATRCKRVLHLPRPLAALYSCQAEATSIMQGVQPWKTATSGAVCPFCKVLAVPPGSSPSLVTTPGAPKLALVGSATLRPICSRCAKDSVDPAVFAISNGCSSP